MIQDINVNQRDRAKDKTSTGDVVKVAMKVILLVQGPSCSLMSNNK